MEKTFKIQKISMVIYIIAIVCSFIYSLYFMTNYANLRGFSTALNKELIDFYKVTLQGYNFMIYNFAVAGLISILVLFAFQVFKKVCDKLALVFVNLFGFAGFIGAILAIVRIPGIIAEYNTEGMFDYVYYEQIASWSHEMTYTTFYVGYAVYAFVLIGSIMLIGSTILNYKKYTKEMVGN